MKRKLFTLLLLAGTVILSAQEVKLMFGGLKKPLRKEQAKFLDFRYVSQHDPMFSARKKMPSEAPDFFFGILRFGILNSIKGIAQKLKKGASSMTEQNAIFRLTV